MEQLSMSLSRLPIIVFSAFFLGLTSCKDTPPKETVVERLARVADFVEPDGYSLRGVALPWSAETREAATAVVLAARSLARGSLQDELISTLGSPRHPAGLAVAECLQFIRFKEPSKLDSFAHYLSLIRASSPAGIGRCVQLSERAVRTDEQAKKLLVVARETYFAYGDAVLGMSRWRSPPSFLYARIVSFLQDHLVESQPNHIDNMLAALALLRRDDPATLDLAWRVFDNGASTALAVIGASRREPDQRRVLAMIGAADPETLKAFAYALAKCPRLSAPVSVRLGKFAAGSIDQRFAALVGRSGNNGSSEWRGMLESALDAKDRKIREAALCIVGHTPERAHKWRKEIRAISQSDPAQQLRKAATRLLAAPLVDMQ